MKSLLLLTISFLHLLSATKNYKLIGSFVSINDAKAACQNTYGTDLASIHSTADQTAVTNLCQNVGGDPPICWLGGYGGYLNQPTCDYAWDDGTSWDYIPTYDGNEGCGGGQPRLCILQNRYGLHDCHEGHNAWPICNPPRLGYKIIPQFLNINQAKQACHDYYGTDLASIHNAAEQKLVTDLCQNVGGNPSICWLGGYGGYLNQPNCDYAWDDGTSWDYTPTYDGNEGCGGGQPRLCILQNRYGLHDCHEGHNGWPICNDEGYDLEFALKFAPYLRFDHGATDGVNGFPTTYNYPNGVASQQNMNSDISRIPSYYHIFRSDSSDPKRITSIGYYWYYAFQTACAYDGITVLDSLPGDLESAITDAIGGLGIIDPDSIGQHNNDVEKIFVNLNTDYTLKSVTYEQHGDKYTVLPSNGLELYLSTHPTVYIGRTSHGSYHNIMSSVGGCGHFHDYRDGAIRRESWLNLQAAFWKNSNSQRDDGWNDNNNCKGIGCNWDKCITSQQIYDNPEYCTPLQCTDWDTSCLPWGLSDIVQSAADIKDKYFILQETGDPNCECVDIPFVGEVCAGEEIEGTVCTPQFGAVYPNIDIHPNIHRDGKDNYNPYSFEFKKIWAQLIGIALLLILLLINTLIYIYFKCIKKQKNAYQSVKVLDSSQSDDDGI